MVRRRAASPVASFVRVVRIEPDSPDPMEAFLFDAEQQLEAQPQRIVSIAPPTNSPGAVRLQKQASRLVDAAPRRLQLGFGRTVAIVTNTAASRPAKGIRKGRAAQKKKTMEGVVARVAPNARIVSRAQGRATKAQGWARHHGARPHGNPHSAGYSCRLAPYGSGDACLSEDARLASGKPSILRCIWRGLFRVKGLEGGGVRDGLLSAALRRTLYRYSQQGQRSIYNLVNRTLKGARGRDLHASRTRAWVVDLVSAVRLLWDPTTAPEKVYRGVPRADLGVYRSAMKASGAASGAEVQWDAFASCSRARKVALSFAGAGASGSEDAVLFTIRLAPDSQRATAANVSAYSAFPDEHEVLLLPCMRFHVLAMHAREGFTEVLLQEAEGVYPRARE